MGLNVTASSSLWVVREMYNGRKVKYGYFIAKPILTIGNKMFILIATRLMKFSDERDSQKPRNRMRIKKVVVYQ